MTQKRRANYMKQADRYFSQYIRNRDGSCVAPPPHKGSLQCAHIISRSYKSIRTNEDNAVALCAKHHVGFTHRPLEWRMFVETLNPGLWDELVDEALRYERVDWKTEAAKWKARI